MLILVTMYFAVPSNAQNRPWMQMFHPPSESIAPLAFEPPIDPLQKPPTPTANPRQYPSVAVIEFQESGLSWTKCPDNDTDAGACQENRANHFIAGARDTALSEGKHLVVLTFVHGWHHNASEYSENFRNFQQMVDCLNWGESEYARVYGYVFNTRHEVLADNVSCVGVKPSPSTKFAGIYVGWRGESQEKPSVLSLFNRHDAAERVANGDLGDTLKRLSQAAKTTTTALPEPARFVIVGHSFGGLIVSRIMARMLEKELDVDSPAAPVTCTVGEAETGHRGFVDLAVVINAADSAIRGAELMRAMKLAAAKYPGFFCSSDGKLATSLPRPILVSIHTPSDDATGEALHIGFELTRLDAHYPRKANLDLTKQYDTPNNSELASTFEVLRTYPLNHDNYLHTLCYLDQDGNGDWVCDRVNQLVTLAKAAAYKNAGIDLPPNLERGAYELVMAQCNGQDMDENSSRTISCDAASLDHRNRLLAAMVATLKPYLAIPTDTFYAQPTRLLDLYTRLDQGCKRLDSNDEKDTRPDCDPKEGAQPEWPDHQPAYLHPPVAPWNSTPFWEFNVPFHTIQKHNGFWNEEVITLITGIAASSGVTPRD